MRAYIDSDILIGHLRGDLKALHFLNGLQGNKEYEFWVGAIQRAEIVFFMRKDEEKNTVLFLSQFKTAPIDQAIIDAGGILYRRWNPTHGTDINDVLLAATVMQTGGKIYGLNKKHYPMPEIIFEKPYTF
jgi:predicted nucleic acid-binding protein